MNFLYPLHLSHTCICNPYCTCVLHTCLFLFRKWDCCLPMKANCHRVALSIIFTTHFWLTHCLPTGHHMISAKHSAECHMTSCLTSNFSSILMWSKVLKLTFLVGPACVWGYSSFLGGKLHHHQYTFGRKWVNLSPLQIRTAPGGSGTHVGEANAKLLELNVIIAVHRLWDQSWQIKALPCNRKSNMK